MKTHLIYPASAALLLVAFTWSSAAAPAAEFREPTKITVPNCVVHIRAIWGEQHATGTGVVVDRSTVLTAAHVINRGARLAIVFGGRDGRPETVVERGFFEFDISYAQQGRDCARIRKVEVPAWIIPAAGANVDPPPGTLVTTYGLCDPDAARVRQARVVPGPGGIADINIIHVGVTSEPGDSGSPIFNEQGVLVAILEGSLGWRDVRFETRRQQTEWGTFVEIRQRNEPRNATVGVKLHNVKWMPYVR